MTGVEGRVALVSGGASGIGYATVDRLLSEGWRVAFVSLHEESVSKAVESLSQTHDQSRIMGRALNVADAHAVSSFISQIGSAWEAPSAVVCNAGISPKPARAGVFEDFDPSVWQSVVDVNLMGAVHCIAPAVGNMRKSGFGRIVFVGSLAARTMPRIAGAPYAATKAALSGMARVLVSEYSGAGVTTNVVAPGRILTEMTGTADTPANRAALERIPAGRLGQPEDVARAIAFLLSPESGFINGAVLDVNGGEFCPL